MFTTSKNRLLDYTLILKKKKTKGFCKGCKYVSKMAVQDLYQPCRLTQIDIFLSDKVYYNTVENLIYIYKFVCFFTCLISTCKRWVLDRCINASMFVLFTQFTISIYVCQLLFRNVCIFGINTMYFVETRYQIYQQLNKTDSST